MSPIHLPSLLFFFLFLCCRPKIRWMGKFSKWGRGIFLFFLFLPFLLAAHSHSVFIFFIIIFFFSFGSACFILGLFASLLYFFSFINYAVLFFLLKVPLFLFFSFKIEISEIQTFQFFLNSFKMMWRCDESKRTHEHWSNYCCYYKADTVRTMTQKKKRKKKKKKKKGRKIVSTLKWSFSSGRFAEFY